MKTIALILLTATLCQAQTTFPVPVQILDSMFFEIRQGRTCDSIQHLQSLQIDLLNQAVTAGLKSIQLKDSAISALQASNKAAQREIEAREELREIETSSLKKSVKRNRFIAYTSSGAAIGSVFGQPVMGVAIGAGVGFVVNFIKK
jgi:hypothetical protein